jgi:imidazolonepropionase-like amidohydrolase
MTRTLFTNGRILTCDEQSPDPFFGEVLLEGDRILDVRRGTSAAFTDAQVVDVAGATIMPGLGDAHVHFGQPLDFEFDYLGAAMAAPEDAALSTAAVARAYIENGITTCVSGGNASARGDVALREAIERGWITGPRVVPGGQIVSDPKGIPSFVMPTTVAEMRRIVAEQCDLGVEVIKVFLSGENVMPPGSPTIRVEDTFVGDELLGAMVDEASRHGAFVNAHARGAGSVALAARAGVRLISHASYVDDEGLRLLTGRTDVWICPGVYYLWAMPHLAPEPYCTLAKDGGYPQEYDDAVKTIARFVEAGVPLLAGGDYGHVWQPHGQAARDIQHFVERVDMDPYQALLTGTRNMAGLTGWDIGRLRSGALADLVILDGDPLADLTVLTDSSRRRAVVKAGAISWLNPAGLDRL